jgi:hypothetical protein
MTSRRRLSLAAALTVLGSPCGIAAAQDAPVTVTSRPSIALVLAGGGALDDELLRTVSEALRGTGVVVGRANVDGVHGPRFAVASGLVHLYARARDQ